MLILHIFKYLLMRYTLRLSCQLFIPGRLTSNHLYLSDIFFIHVIFSLPASIVPVTHTPILAELKKEKGRCDVLINLPKASLYFSFPENLNNWFLYLYCAYSLIYLVWQICKPYWLKLYKRQRAKVDKSRFKYVPLTIIILNMICAIRFK